MFQRTPVPIESAAQNETDTCRQKRQDQAEMEKERQNQGQNKFIRGRMKQAARNTNRQYKDTHNNQRRAKQTEDDFEK